MCRERATFLHRGPTAMEICGSSAEAALIQRERLAVLMMCGNSTAAIGVAWMDKNGNLWVFGGGGLDSTGTSGSLNDLWKFDGTNWTWLSGSNTVNQSGVYGTKGTAASSNLPGAREGLISWIDASGTLWL